MKIKLFTNSGIFERNIVIDGFTMSGFLVLSRNPMTAYEAATKRYVDNFPYNLDIENVQGGPIPIERIAAGIEGDISMYNGNTSVLKSVMTAGSYSRVTVNTKGQVVGGVSPSADMSTPSLMFSEIKNRPTDVSGYATTPANYIRNTPGVENTAFTGSLTLSRAPTSDTEVASFNYLTTKAANAAAGGKIGSLVMKPNTKSHAKYLRANGGSVDQATYSVLYAIIGDMYTRAVDTSSYSGLAGQPWRLQYLFNNTEQSSITNWKKESAPGPAGSYRYVVTKNKIHAFTANSSAGFVYTAPIYPDGTVGAFQQTSIVNPFHSGYYPTIFITTKNAVYAMGTVVGSVIVGTHWKFPINEDGSLGAPEQMGSTAPSVYGTTPVSTKSRVYLIGGNSTTYNNGLVNTIQSAAYNSDGTLGVWSTSGATLPFRVMGGVVTAIKNYVYLIGGYVYNPDGQGSIERPKTIYRAVIDVNGNLGAWSLVGTIPWILDSIDHACVVTKNRLFIIGGSSGENLGDKVLSCSIDSNGNLGSTWTINDAAVDGVAINLSARQPVITSSRLYSFSGVTTYSTPFEGGLNDYTSLLTGIAITVPGMFRLPDLSAKNSGIYEYYIKALS